jgi:hypothetical protein
VAEDGFAVAGGAQGVIKGVSAARGLARKGLDVLREWRAGAAALDEGVRATPDVPNLFTYMTRERYERFVANDKLFQPRSGMAFATDLATDDPAEAAQLFGLRERPEIRVEWSTDQAMTFERNGVAQPVTQVDIGIGDYAVGDQMELARWGGVNEYTSQSVLDLTSARVTLLDETAAGSELALASARRGELVEAELAAVTSASPVTLTVSSITMDPPATSDPIPSADFGSLGNAPAMPDKATSDVYESSTQTADAGTSQVTEGQYDSVVLPEYSAPEASSTEWETMTSSCEQGSEGDEWAA